MRQLLLPRVLDDGGRYEATGEDFHYLARVLRLREGAVVPAGDAGGGRYRLILVKRETDRLVFRAQREWDQTPGAPASSRLTLLICLPKPVKMDLIVRMSAEVGVGRIIPLVSAYSAVREKDIPRLEERVERWRKIARAAYQQCGRRDLPVVEGIRSFDGIDPAVPGEELCLYADERGGRALHAVVGAGGVDHTRVLVGPEGGLSDQERETLGIKGYVPVFLGENILRTETAAVIMCAAVTLLVSERAAWKPK
jgi:16S rRNA (uracil1498-N3)-methyltransferase